MPSVILDPISAITEHDQPHTAAFDCGDTARNRWLTTMALASQQRDNARTYLNRDNHGAIRGFYAITTTSILRSLLHGQFKRNAPQTVGCLLLAQLGVDLSCQRKGLGRELVLHAMRQAVAVAEISGCRLFVVHSANPAVASWYRNFGFTEVDTTPGSLLVMSMHQVRALLAAVDTQ